MARGKWFIPYKANRLNYEDVGASPYFVQHDIGFSGGKIFRAVKWNGPNSGTFTLVGESRMASDTAPFGKRARASDTRKAHALAVADAKLLAGRVSNNPAGMIPKMWTAAKVRVNNRGQVQVKLNPRSVRNLSFRKYKKQLSKKYSPSQARLYQSFRKEEQRIVRARRRARGRSANRRRRY